MPTLKDYQQELKRWAKEVQKNPTQAEVILGDAFEWGRSYEKDQRRTLKQNSAMYEWFTWMSDLFNGHGLTINKVLKQGIEIDWSPEMIKRELWHKVQLEKFPDKVNDKGQPSTALLEKHEVTKVYEELNRYFALHPLISKIKNEIPPFPSEEQLQLNKK
jgi:hypothetical protein